MYYPRVLIVGQSFNKHSGGGITQTNLFKGWPKDRIAVAALGQSLESGDNDICTNYYQLGSEEYIWKFPLSLFFRKYPSGVVSLEPDKNELVRNAKVSSLVRYFLAGKFVGPLLRWTGIFYSASSLNLSDRFRNWIDSYAPEIVYLQVSTFEGIQFAISLGKYFDARYAIHMMDDWPSVIVSKGIFKKYWEQKVDRALRTLMDMVQLHLSIGDAMSIEYDKRYGKKFLAFHNPVDVSVWRECHKTNYEIENREIKVLYAGRIGRGISKSIIDVSESIDRLNESGYKIIFNIQSQSIDINTLRLLKRFDFVKINPIVSYAEVPRVISSSDILLLANDFDSSGIGFLKYSIPTKASEYMMSGVPILLYAPKEIAVSLLFQSENCALCVHEENREELSQAFMTLIDNPDLRRTLGENAIKLARERFDANEVRENFRKTLLKLST